jgi:predicted transcriptional regulator
MLVGMRNPISPGANLDPATVLAAFGNPNRWHMVALMGQGEAVTVNGLVAMTGRGYRAVHKDLAILAASGAVAVRYGEDRRLGFYHIPEQYQPQPGVVDYGFCAVRFGAAAKLAAPNPLAKD